MNSISRSDGKGKTDFTEKGNRYEKEDHGYRAYRKRKDNALSCNR